MECAWRCPGRGEAPAGAGGDMGTGVSRDGKVDINRAGPSDMTRLPGVGEVIAQRIISYREANGPFGTVEDLLGRARHRGRQTGRHPRLRDGRLSGPGAATGRADDNGQTFPPGPFSGQKRDGLAAGGGRYLGGSGGRGQIAAAVLTATVIVVFAAAGGILLIAQVRSEVCKNCDLGGSSRVGRGGGAQRNVARRPRAAGAGGGTPRRAVADGGACRNPRPRVAGQRLGAGETDGRRPGRAGPALGRAARVAAGGGVRLAPRPTLGNPHRHAPRPRRRHRTSRRLVRHRPKLPVSWATEAGGRAGWWPGFATIWLDRLQPHTVRGRALLAGFLLGDTSHLESIDVERMRRSGMSHYVAVSGSNVALFLGALFLAAGPLGWNSRRRAALGLAGLVFFVLLIGPDPSVLRAAVMAGLVLVAIPFGLLPGIWKVMGAGVGMLLLISPELAFSLGFALSVAATAGVVVGSAWFPAVKPRWLGTSLGASCGGRRRWPPFCYWPSAPSPCGPRWPMCCPPRWWPPPPSPAGWGL